MPAWSKIEQEIWRDGDFLPLTPQAKSLFIFSFTHCPSASIAGLSVVSERQMARVLAGERDAVEPTLIELGAKPFVVYDWDAELLWCVNRLKRSVSQSPRWLAGARKIVEQMPQESDIIRQFKSRYKDVLRDGNK